jgi:ABC-type transport system involved in multi-copper enzyme maturation permease subunit
MTVLLAKEARELTGLVFLCSVAGALIGLSVASQNYDPLFPIDLGAVAVSAALLAAGRFAGEASEGTRAFLVSLPQTRRRIWAGKAVAGLAGTLVVVWVVIAAITLFQSQVAEPAMRSLFTYPSGVALLVAGGVAAYFTTLLCSTCLDSPALAAAAGLTLAFSGYVVAVVVGLVVTGNEDMPMPVAAVGLAVLGAVCALGSAAVFSLRETRHRRHAR